MASLSRLRIGTLATAGFIAIAGGAVWSVHDSMFLAALVAAGGLLWSSREWKAWLVAAPMVVGGLLWSSLDPAGCSSGSRVRLVYEKLVGHLPYVGWDQIKRQALSACAEEQGPVAIEQTIRELAQKIVQGRKCTLYRTNLGDFWIPEPGKGLLSWLLWEISVQHDYESGRVAVSPGDTVIDCGAHVGTFTRYALNRGASRVVAIEPEVVNTAMLEANFAPEIASGRVKLIKAGVWDRRETLELQTNENSARNSFLKKEAAAQTETMVVLPLDEIVAELALDRVDFIKMDIEGAERRALRGAQQTIAAFKPRMAICTYHLIDDAVAIPTVVKNILPDYQIQAKDIEIGWSRFTPKVMFFDYPAAGKPPVATSATLRQR